MTKRTKKSRTKNKKKNARLRLSPQELIAQNVELIPNYYHAKESFAALQEALEQGDLHVVLKRLVELAGEPNHFYSDDFWLDLSVAADNIEMILEAEYCRNQVENNKKLLGYSPAKGETIVKLDDNTFQHYQAQKLIDRELNRRRQKHNLASLIKENGFHRFEDGRAGMIYYIEDEKVLEIEIEMSAIDGSPIVYYSGLNHWALPTRDPLSDSEKNRIKSKLDKWLSPTGSLVFSQG